MHALGQVADLGLEVVGEVGEDNSDSRRRVVEGLDAIQEEAEPTGIGFLTPIVEPIVCVPAHLREVLATDFA